MLAVIELNDSASSPSWSREWTTILCEKSPPRTFSVPSKSSCTAPVIERASTNPMRKATARMMRNNTATIASAKSSSCAMVMSLIRAVDKNRCS